MKKDSFHKKNYNDIDEIYIVNVIEKLSWKDHFLVSKSPDLAIFLYILYVEPLRDLWMQ